MSDMECGVRSRQRELLTVSGSDNYCELYSDAVIPQCDPTVAMVTRYIAFYG